MGKPKRYKLKEFKKLLEKNGYKFERYGKGDHMIYSNDVNKITITTTGINVMVARRLIKENNLIE